MLDFLERFINVHGDKYDYSNINNIDFDNTKNKKVEIICPIHGSFFQNPYKHISGRGCGECRREKSIKSFENDFLKKSNKIHNNKYDYSDVRYVDQKTHVNIICPIHGEFNQAPYLHLRGRGCRICKSTEIGKKKRIKYSEFVKRANEIHNNKYDYSISKFEKTRDKIDIICPAHGTFNQNANSHLLGVGCPTCRSSNGELFIMKLLDEYGINYIREYRFDDCVKIYKLPFDFFLPEKNTCIEYDGIQHFEPIDFFGGYESMIKLRENDEIKNNYCLESNIKMIRIKYTHSNNEICNIIKDL